MGIADDYHYGKMASQKIGQAVRALVKPTYQNIRGVVEEVITRIYEEHVLKPWPGTPGLEQPNFQLIVGAEGEDDQFGVLETHRTSVTTVDSYTSIDAG